MKKRILSIILLIVVSFMIFNLNIHADTTMALQCNVGDPHINGVINYGGERTFVKLTDNTGQVFFLPLGVDNSMKTIPNYYWDNNEIVGNEMNDKFNNGKCPSTMGYSLAISSSPVELFNVTTNDIFRLYGEKNAEIQKTLDKPRYVIYEMISQEREKRCEQIKEKNENLYDIACKRLIIAEGYNKNGAFAFVGPDLEAFIIDEVVKHQKKLINKEEIGLDYFKIDEKNETLIGNNYTIDKLYDNWYEKYADFVDYNDYHVKILYASSGVGRQEVTNVAQEWLNKNEGSLSGYNDITTVIKDKDFVDECTNVTENLKDGTKYDISKINVSNMLTKLNDAQQALDKAYSVEFTDCGTGYKTSATSALTSCIVYSETLGINEIVDLAYKENDEHIMNQGFIVEALYNDISNSLKTALEINNNKINIIDAASSLNVYTEKFYTVIAYLRSKANTSRSELEEYKKQINDIYDSYKEMVERHELNIYPVVDCETLLGEELIDKINSYLNIFKIAVPIILIGFGIVDFTKAIFAGEEEMKKAQKAFIKRLFIALLIFLIPTVVNLILYLANKVWPIISTDSCGLF